ncbi:DEAD/DEAH box helicase [Culturomica massiliensis]|uniref:DEAD/DEAH box helicase n=2 Tax=Culturomica massiliensis TaxID=1841857 RepID=UPI003AB5924A
MEKFKELGLEGEILKGIADLGFETPSPVQEKVIPVILGEENDLVALAQTGTGKTAAFGLPLLQKLDASLNKIQVLILSPTRELCVQIGNDLKNYSKYRSDIRITCVYGGTDIRRQIRELEKGVHVLVATPGRLCDLIKRGAVNIEAVRAVVLDEADEMLNMGFKEDLNFILEETPAERNTYLFSATMPREVERIARNYLHSPKEISVGKKNQGADTVSHQYYQVRAKDCYETLHRVIDCAPDMYAIIFTRTKMDAREIAHKLQKDGIDCDALHGDLSQSQRDDVMARFRSKRLKVLVATDVAARGLDVDNLTHVINYNLPEDSESYTHRSGRTGRAGREGISVAIINSKEKGKLRRIESILKKKFEYREVPGGEEVCRAQLLYYADKILTAERKDALMPYQQELFEKFEALSKEELIQKIVSYEFGRLLKKYTGVENLNLSEDERHESGREGGKERGGRSRSANNNFTVFSVNVGRDDDFTPRDLMAIVNKYAPQKGLEIGGIRIFDNKTKFEVDITGIENFGSYFRNVNFNGLPFTVTETGERGGEMRKGERGGKRSSTANNKWKGERRKNGGNSRGRFGEKKKGVDNGRRSGKKY